MDKLRILILFVFVVLISKSEGLRRCYECTAVPFPRNCLHLTMCGDGEDCYLEQVVTSGGFVLYNSGCKATSRCGVGKRDIIDQVARSDRGTDIVTCASCCSEEFCNNKGCGQTDVPRDQRGPICFTCDSVIHPSTCNQVSACAPTDVCALILRADSVGYTEAVYQGFCQSKVACETIVQIQNNSLCQPSCCEDDYCNVKCGLTTGTTAIPTTTTPQPATTQPTTTQSSTTPTPCKVGNFYDDISGICVRIVSTQTHNYNNARHACSVNGERLAVIDSHEKMVFMEYIMMRHINIEYNKNFGFWIGLSNKDDHSPFIWINGDPLSYTYWGGGDEVAGNQQPDHNQHQNCVVIYPLDHFMWHDATCGTHYGYVCEEFHWSG